MDSRTRRGDSHLWLTALGLSLLANTALVATVGFITMKSLRLREKSVPVSEPAPSVAMIYPVLAENHAAPVITPATALAAAAAAAAPAPETIATAGHRFARTSQDQSAPRPDTPAFMGERNTRATSDRPPEPTAPPMPSQAGITPKDAMDIETTESNYQDGSLASTQAAVSPTDPSTTPPARDTPIPADSSPAKDAAALPPPHPTGPAPVSNPPPARELLLDGPHPVDVPVPREVAKEDAIKPKPEDRQTARLPPLQTTGPAKTLETPKPTPPREPGFRGFQRKTAVTGSISRTGRSALDVEDSPLGRYQAALSRAVELEWQRNCVRHRDFITPGFLTVRFFVEPGGKVRSVQFVGDMATGEVQKGFTLNSIRDAEIPPMPATLRKQYDKEPLELIFRFFF
ncbi:MAG: hypothetical protein NTV46_18610 [Verrucomicrobia bacterium]|nr:hypothetical protein [Verrucomicrobiota bacterium]